jgi:hypothetical protein
MILFLLFHNLLLLINYVLELTCADFSPMFILLTNLFIELDHTFLNVTDICEELVHALKQFQPLF